MYKKSLYTLILAVTFSGLMASPIDKKPKGTKKSKKIVQKIVPVEVEENPYYIVIDKSDYELKVYDEKLATTNFSAEEALSGLVIWMNKNNCKTIISKTQILIAPGYTFRIVKAIITNFHQPQSTLLLLVAAAIGENWRKMYDHALQNNFRFLSYGDGSLIFLKCSNGDN